MTLSSLTHTKADQPGGAAPHFGPNNNVALDQASLFYGGAIAPNLGAFAQVTFDGVGRVVSWDNVDIRYARTASLFDAETVLGVSLNNNPTVQDSFNTLAAWGFPYTTSALAPHPAAAPLVGNLAQNTLGLTGYTWVNSEIYAEFGGYRSLGAGFLTHAGVSPFTPGSIDGVAPYARLAYQKNFGERNFELGAFWMNAALFPGRDQSTGSTDQYADLGLDASLQYFAANRDVFTVNGIYTHERQRLDASRALGLASNDIDSLQQARLDASYYWRNRVGLTAQLFDTWGSRDNLLYGANRTFRPDSSGLTLQLDGTPYGDGRSPLGRRFNVRMGVQYTAYFTFDGAARNFDGLGRNASDNNTVRVFTWIYY
jgi:hypothetical protein